MLIYVFMGDLCVHVHKNYIRYRIEFRTLLLGLLSDSKENRFNFVRSMNL